MHPSSPSYALVIRAVTINWDVVNTEHHKILAASNNNENKSCLEKQHAQLYARPRAYFYLAYSHLNLY